MRNKEGYKDPTAGAAIASVRRQEKRRRKEEKLNRKQAQAMPENLPIAILVAGINNSLDILQKRGIPILDWDQKKRELYRLKVFSGKVYFLAAELDRSEQKNEEGERSQWSRKINSGKTDRARKRKSLKSI